MVRTKKYGHFESSFISDNNLHVQSPCLSWMFTVHVFNIQIGYCLYDTVKEKTGIIELTWLQVTCGVQSGYKLQYPCCIILLGYANPHSWNISGHDSLLARNISDDKKQTTPGSLILCRLWRTSLYYIHIWLRILS